MVSPDGMHGTLLDEVRVDGGLMTSRATQCC